MRDDGTTTRQMQAATRGAVFVWGNSQIGYPKGLAKHIGREDLKIVSPSWLEDRWRGLKLTGVMVDHAATLTDQQWNGLHGAMTRGIMRERR